jgi:hypothetical protein
LPAQLHSDETVIAAYNDRRAFPTLEALRDHLGYSDIRVMQVRLTKLRRKHPGRMIDRKAIYQQAKSSGENAAARSIGQVLATATGDSSVRRWLLTAAQDETSIHEGFWTNLLAYGQKIGAEVLVGGFTYNKSLFEDHASRTAVFAASVQPYLIHDNRMLGPLLFAAKMNTLPTAVRPLSGLANYGRGAWTVFPHAKVQLDSVPSLPGRHPAMVMTTGACTVDNYIPKKAGLKAEFHHQIGAVIVEVDGADRIFCRHIGATNDGSFQDLDAIVRNGDVTFGNRVEAITWGDIHREQLDPQVALTCWGFDVASGQIVREDSLINALRPRHQFFHDLLDFRARNHHRRDDHVHAKRMQMLGAESVAGELRDCAHFLRATQRDYCQSVVVASNHNDALLRWLRETDPRRDPLNLRTWCQLNDKWHEQLEIDPDGHFDLFRFAVTRHDPGLVDDVTFVPRNGNYLICQDRGGIECGMHGDEGPNGARGTVVNLSQVGVRLTVGHGHSAKILDGVHMVGLCGKLDQGYNSGPSGWSHTQGVTYPNSRRTLLTIIDGKYRA